MDITLHVKGYLKIIRESKNILDILNIEKL